MLFQHGLFDSAYAWVVHHKDRAPAYIASRNGYDVWLMNSRGSGPSRIHKTMDPDATNMHDKFWHFDWQDMGREDMPAVFKYIINKTQYSKIGVIAHQEGTT